MLTVQASYGVNRVMLPAGQIVIYPADSVHRVTPVTRGARFAAVFWVQSLVRSSADGALLFQLDTSIQRLAADRGLDDEEVVRLTAVYHNLLRRWGSSSATAEPGCVLRLRSG